MHSFPCTAARKTNPVMISTIYDKKIIAKKSERGYFAAMKTEIGQRISRLRNDAGLKQGDVAAALGVDVRTYRTREQGQYFFPVPELAQIAEYFGVSLDYLLTGKVAGELDADQQRLLRWWDKMKPEDRNMIYQYMMDAADRED